MEKIEQNSKKLFKIDQNLYEELSYSEIIERYDPFINNKAKAFTFYVQETYSKHVSLFSFDDLKQIIYLGFLRAYQSYDITKNVIFYTYMQPVITSYVMNYIRELTRFRRKVNDYSIITVYLDSDIKTKSNGEETMRVSDVIPSQTNEIQKIIDKNFYEDLFSVLNSREKSFIKLFFYEKMAQEDIAKLFSLSQSSISRTVKKALEKMNKHIKKQM